MGFKNVISENRIQVNKYTITFQPNVGEVLFTTIGALEAELDKADLPDRTSRSGGRTKPIEFDVTQPMHHDEGQVQAMENWWDDCQDPVAPDHLKVGTLVLFDQQGAPRKSYTLINAWLFKQGTPELDMDNDGEQALITWSISIDDVLRN